MGRIEADQGHHTFRRVTLVTEHQMQRREDTWHGDCQEAEAIMQAQSDEDPIWGWQRVWAGGERITASGDRGPCGW